MDSRLVEYIRSAISQGISHEDIYKELISQGFKLQSIQEAFAYMGNVPEHREDSSKRTINIVVSIGAILVGAGVFSFIASNWQTMTDFLRVAIILFGMVVSYIIGWYLIEKMRMPRLGNALIFLGTIIYGAGIFLVAQIFNIRTTWPDGFIIWMIGVLTMAFVFESYYLFGFAFILGAISLFGYPFELASSWGYSPFLMTSSLLLLLATIVSFISAWVIRKKIPQDLKEFY